MDPASPIDNNKYLLNRTTVIRRKQFKMQNSLKILSKFTNN
jgi:hypothetical protein